MLPAVDFRYLVEIRTEWNQDRNKIRQAWNQDRMESGQNGIRTGVELGQGKELMKTNEVKRTVANQRGGFSLYMHSAASQALG